MLGFRRLGSAIAYLERGAERERARYVNWTSLPDIRKIGPALRWMIHMPNGGKRKAIAGGQTRALGVKPGVPDLLRPLVNGPDCGLALEFKSATGRMAPQQDEWAGHLTANGWLVLKVRSADTARAAVMHYLDMELPAL